MITFDVEDLRKLAPGAHPDILPLFAPAPVQFAQAGILENPNRLCHFTAQVMQETGGLKSLHENLHYTAAELKSTWPHRFKTDDIANEYANQPEKIADFVYGGRLGNTDPGDGYKYRGRGLLQLTGKDNYQRVENVTKLPLVADPDLVTRPETALQVAVLYWTNARDGQGRSCNDLADHDDIEGVTALINGGQIGIEGRKQYLDLAKKLWVAAAAAGVGAAAAGAAAAASTGASASTTAASEAGAAPASPAAPAASPGTASPPSASAPGQPSPPARSAPSAQTAPPARTGAPAPSQSAAPAQPAPQQRGGTTLSAIVAFLAGAVAFVVALFEKAFTWLKVEHAQLETRLGFDPLWIVAGVFALAILIVILIRAEHRGKLKKAAAGS